MGWGLQTPATLDFTTQAFHLRLTLSSAITIPINPLKSSEDSGKLVKSGRCEEEEEGEKYREESGRGGK